VAPIGRPAFGRAALTDDGTSSGFTIYNQPKPFYPSIERNLTRAAIESAYDLTRYERATYAMVGTP
jgi:hypothetical protein